MVASDRPPVCFGDMPPTMEKRHAVRVFRDRLLRYARCDDSTPRVELTIQQERDLHR